MMQKVKESDVVVYVGGITARLEGEEMPVQIEGFEKGDRTNLKLPKVQHELLKELHKLGKPVKPPKILIEAKKIAINPKILVKLKTSLSISTICKIAPTITIPEIAFVTDINGV